MCRCEWWCALLEIQRTVNHPSGVESRLGYYEADGYSHYTFVADSDTLKGRADRNRMGAAVEINVLQSTTVIKWLRDCGEARSQVAGGGSTSVALQGPLQYHRERYWQREVERVHLLQNGHRSTSNRDYLKDQIIVVYESGQVEPSDSTVRVLMWTAKDLPLTADGDPVPRLPGTTRP